MLYVHTLSSFGARGFPYLFLAMMLILAPVQASDFPNKPVKVIVPFGPGGASDVLARTVQEAIRRENLSPEPFAIYNIPGAGGSIGSYRVKNARPDGYTILNLHDGILTAKHQGVTTYGTEAFVPIAATGSSHTVVCVGPKYEVKDLAALLERAASEPGTIRFGANVGAPSHFVGLLLEQERDGAEFRFVAAGGGASRFSDLAGGHLDVSIFSTSEYLQFASGGLRALAYLAPDRHPDIPDIPTGREQGVKLVTGTTQFWWAPLGTPEDRVEKLADILEAAMASDWLQAEYQRFSVDPVYLRGEAMMEEVERIDSQLAAVSVRQSMRSVPIVPFVLGAVLLCTVICALPGTRKSGPAAEQVSFGRVALWILIAVSSYCLIIGWRIVPFWICTFLFAAGAGLLIGKTRGQHVSAVICAFVLASLLQVLFGFVLKIDLP